MKDTVYDEKLITQLFDNQPDAVVWYTPVFSTGSNSEVVEDFKVRYCNAAASEALNAPAAEMLASSIRSTFLMDSTSKNRIFEQCLQVWKTGEPVEFTYYNSYFNRYFNIQRSRVMDGILSITRDRTDLVLAEIEKEQQRKLLSSIIENSSNGISLYESIYDASGAICDFRLKICNKKTAELSGFTMEELHNHTVKELLEVRANDVLLQQAIQVVETAIPNYTEYYSPQLKRWVAFSIVKFENGFLLNAIDVTQTKQQTAFVNSILDASLSAIYVAEAMRNEKGSIVDFRILKTNKRFMEMTGYTEEVLSNKTVLSIYPGIKENGFFSFLCGVIATGEAVRKEMHYQSKGKDNWYEYTIVRMGQDGVVVTYNDITEQKKAALETAHQKNLLDSILKNSASGITVSEALRDEEGKVVDGITIIANEASVQFTGVPGELLLTKTFCQLDPNFRESELFHTGLKVLESGNTVKTLNYIESKNKWVELAVSKMDDNHLVNVLTDVTAVKEAAVRKKQLNEQLQAKIEELERSNRNLEEFTYAASHDLQEPLRKIHTFSDRLQETLKLQLNEGQLYMFERMEAATKRMKNLIDDLLAYSHTTIQTGAFSGVNLNEVVEEVLNDMEVAIEQKKAHITIDNLPQVNGNHRQLKQLFLNLFSNALKYSKEGEPPQITITSKEVKGQEAIAEFSNATVTHNYYLIEVKDNGIGFEQEHAVQIFKVFQRLHGRHEYSGTGVGLAIVRKVVDNHNGYIIAEGAIGKGATFKILLPA